MASPPLARSASRVALGLALLVLAAFLARAAAVPRLLPHSPEPDTFVVQLAQDMRDDPALVQGTDYAERYPNLLARLIAAAPWPGGPVDPRAPDAADQVLRSAAGPYLAGRWVVLVLSLLAIPGTWLVARRIAGEAAAWIASALVATSMLHALFSTQGRPHAPQAAFAVWAVWAAMRMAERPTAVRCALTIAFSSLALATIQIGAATLPPLALAAWLAGGTIGRRLARAAIVPALAVACALWAYPFSLRFDGHGLRLGGSGAHEVDWSRADFSGFGQLVGWLQSHDPTLLVLLVIGFAVVAVRWRASARVLVEHKDVAVAWGYVLPYVCFLGPLDQVFERFLLPLLPWIATFGAAAIVRLAGERRRRLLPALAVAALAFPTWVLVRFARVSRAPDSAELTAQWLVSDPARLDAPIVASAGLVLPAPFEREALKTDLLDPSGRASVWPRYLGTLPDATIPPPRIPLIMLPAMLAAKPDKGLEAWFLALKPAYVVLERSRKNLFLDGGRKLTELVHARGELVFATTGVAPEIEELGVLHYQTQKRYVPRLLETERFGPSLEVWRMRW
jgi:hypothetical protein